MENCRGRIGDYACKEFESECAALYFVRRFGPKHEAWVMGRQAGLDDALDIRQSLSPEGHPVIGKLHCNNPEPVLAELDEQEAYLLNISEIQ